MLDHGEATVRAFFERIPDGRYVARAVLDSDGVGEDEVPFDVVVEVDGSSVRVDFSEVPDALPGPLNCPQPGTVSSTRLALMMLAGGGDAPNDGHFRPIEIVTRPGSMFHPLPPSPCFLYGWPFLQSTSDVSRARAGDTGGRAGLERRQHPHDRVVGEPRVDRRAVGRCVASSDRARRERTRRRRRARSCTISSPRRGSRRSRSGRRAIRGSSSGSSLRRTPADPG